MSEQPTHREMSDATAEAAWAIMDTWQSFVETRPDDESALALLDLMTDVLLSHMAYRDQWDLQTTLLFWHEKLSPLMARHVRERWNDEGTYEDEGGER